MTNFKAAKPAKASSLARNPQGRALNQTPRFAPSLLALALSSALALPGAALANDWVGTVSGDWFTAGNWNNNATVPAATDNVFIDTSAPNAATINAAGALANGMLLGSTAGSTGSLDIQAGGTLASDSAHIGAAVGGTGTVTVDGNGTSWQNGTNATNGELSVGYGGTGTLNILNLGLVNDTDGFVGHAAGSTGTAVVNNASWVHTGYMSVGDGGTGTLMISNAGAVNNANGVVGAHAGATGTVSVDGIGSTWDNSATLVVGGGGTGTLTITQGGFVASAQGVVGEQTGGTGTVNVSGAGSAWNSSGDLFVGFAGNGTLNITSAGSVNNVSGIVGGLAGGTGTVQVDGTGSFWANTGGLTVGNFGAGTVTVSNGATLSSLVGSLGSATGASGTVTVTGPGSSWVNTSALYVGDSGSGTLVISNGGAVTNTQAILGYQIGSSGSATVDGTNSTWTSSADLYVGAAGTGSLSILNGGKVSNATGYIGASPSGLGVGTVTVDGAGSTWTNNGDLALGVNGKGTLAVTNGGVVNSAAAYVDGNASAATISGTGSAWNNSSDLHVGWMGNGTLDITNGGLVNNAAGWVGEKATGTGTANVSGANALWNNTGNLYVGNDGTGTLNISNGGQVNDAIGVLGFAANSSGTATVDGAGSAWLSGGELYVGYGGNGTLTISNGGVVGTAGFFVSIASQAGSTGTLNIGGAVGAAPAAPGVLAASVLNFGAGTGTINFNHSDTSGNYDFGSNISGAGTINHVAGWTNLSGNSTGFNGATNVSGGRLAVNGTLDNSNVTVSGTGILGGTGTVGSTAVAAGGTIAPGNSIGTLNVNGNVTFAAGSFFQVETNPAGQSDKLLVSGIATINGGTVQVIGGTGNYNPATSYAILTAQGGVTGTFANATSDLAFLDPTLSYTANDVSLTLTRNSTPMGGVGQSPGQTNTGNGVQSLGAGAVYNAVLGLSAAQARYAFQQLSGEVHASARSVQVQDSHFVRDASLDRLRALDSEVVANDGGADGEARLLPSVRDLAYWARAMGSWGHLDGDNGSATIQRDTSGFLMGADTRFGEEGRFGLTGGYSRSSFDVADRASSGSSDNYHLGAYAGSRWGDLALRTGISYSWHDVSTSRVVAFPGFLDSLKADYKASTTQAFAELGYRIKTEKADLEPFASLAHVNVSSDGFTERGGPAALTSAGNSNGVTFSTVGLRASTKVSMSGGTDVTARGSIAWRHAFGDTAPTSAVAFAGGTPFAITGAPVARNVAAVDAGLDFRLSNAATLGLSYAGQFGSGLKDHGARLNLNVAF